MYLSRITLHTGQLSPAQLLHLVDRGEYVMHQWLWDLFPGGKERQFLYRREELQGAFRFFVLSQERPAESKNVHHRMPVICARAAYRTTTLFQPAGESNNL